MLECGYCRMTWWINLLKSAFKNTASIPIWSKLIFFQIATWKVNKGVVSYYTRMWNTPHGIGYIWLFWKPLFFSECTRNRPSYKEYLLQVSGIVPVGLCLHILPDASARPVAGSWSDLSCSVRECSVLFLLPGTASEEYFSNILININSLDTKCPMRCDII